MGLPGGRKTQTGAWSTDSDALEDLAAQGIELARRVLDWRQLSKLRSTYTDALPNFINPETKRVHTSYSLAATSTGRLASTEPNLQNIPVRTEEGRKIRAAFIAPQGSQAHQRRLQPDRAARAGACGGHSAAEERPSPRARTFMR
jgi:DNA polymerase I